MKHITKDKKKTFLCIFPAPLFPLAEKGPFSIFSSTKRVHYSSLFGHSGEDQIWSS